MLAGYFLAIFVTFLIPYSIYVVYNAQKVSSQQYQYNYIPKELPVIKPYVNLDGDVVECYKKRHKHENFEEAKYVCNLFGLEREPYDNFDALLDNSVFYHQINKEKKC